MKFLTLLMAATIYARPDAAKPERPERNIEDYVPECAIHCINNFVVNHTKCKLDDYKCICKHKDLENKDAISCVVDQCGFARAKNQVLPSIHDFCRIAGKRSN
ncbi:hypothetical protein NQ176_g6102 [Zarea fungicola]|uniref:Uncharacterized protein n=1 Tax=Zarea fungicola TaxID=93591 RepID=A0ACC1N4Z4_9HYPO|nr:hypothetical protein NQ176_g6102 [Lecanicillium fungicola]